MCCVKSEVSVELNSQRSHYLILAVLLFELDVRVALDWSEWIQITCCAAVETDSWLMTESSWGHSEPIRVWRRPSLKASGRWGATHPGHWFLLDSLLISWAETLLCLDPSEVSAVLPDWGRVCCLVEGFFTKSGLLPACGLQVSCVYLNWTSFKPEHLHALFIFFHLISFPTLYNRLKRRNIYVLFWGFK